MLPIKTHSSFWWFYSWKHLSAKIQTVPSFAETQCENREWLAKILVRKPNEEIWLAVKLHLFRRQKQRQIISTLWVEISVCFKEKQMQNC